MSNLAAESSSTRRRAGDVVCTGLLVASAILNWVVIATIPSLIGSHPVLLEGLGGSEASMVVAGAFARVGRVSLALALAPVLGLANMDPLLWWGGRRCGRSLVARMLPTGPKTERSIGRAEQWFARWGGWAILAARFLPVPSPLLYAAAGWTGMALWRFVLLDLVGAVAYAGLVVGLGYAIWRQRRRRTRPSRGHGPNRGDTGAPWLTLRLCCSAIWSRCSQSVRNGHAEPRGPTTVLLATQYFDEADQLAERIAVIDRGKVSPRGRRRAHGIGKHRNAARTAPQPRATTTRCRFPRGPRPAFVLRRNSTAARQETRFARDPCLSGWLRRRSGLRGRERPAARAYKVSRLPTRDDRAASEGGRASLLRAQVAVAVMLAEERCRMHPLPAVAHMVCFGQTRKVDKQSTISIGSAIYSVPSSLVEERVWVRTHGSELIVVHVDSPEGPREVARHELTTPGRPSIKDEHYPPRPEGALERTPRARSREEAEFLALGPGGEAWLIKAAAAGATRVRRKMVEAVDLAKLHGAEQVENALGICADAGRFGEGDVAAILAHERQTGTVIAFPARTSEESSLQRSTSSWAGFGR